jgi:hypothetical protein
VLEQQFPRSLPSLTLHFSREEKNQAVSRQQQKHKLSFHVPGFNVLINKKTKPGVTRTSKVPLLPAVLAYENNHRAEEDEAGGW